jgi:hypothetical protein
MLGNLVIVVEKFSIIEQCRKSRDALEFPDQAVTQYVLLAYSDGRLKRPSFG